MKRLLFFILLLISIATQLKAQFPAIDVKLSGGKAVVYWVSQYNGIESITIQRSAEPKRNFISIGTLQKQNRGPQKFVDDAPQIGDNYYRLLIVFESEVEWFSDVKLLHIDSSMIVSSKQNIESENIEVKNTNEVVKPGFSFVPSNKIFSDPNSGHIHITLGDALSKRYSVIFFDAQKRKVLTIDRISKEDVIVDKRNLNRKGILSFQLLEAGKEIERGYLNVY